MQKNKKLSVKIMIFCCLIFLGGSILCSWRILKNHAPAQEIITVWMKLPDSMSEQDAQNIYEKLTQGFEQQYPDYGINLLIYTDDSYQEMPDGEIPAILMNIPESDLFQPADLSELIQRLGDWYITDMTEFQEYIPLSWSIPVLFTGDRMLTEHIIEKNNLPEDTITEAVDFYDFLEHPELSVVAESSQLALVENYPETSGAIRMIPVSEQHEIQKNYHDNCFVNADAGKKQQEIGMLWIAYLLSEEAQQILFTEHYGNFPMHEHAFEIMVSQHQGLAVLKEGD